MECRLQVVLYEVVSQLLHDRGTVGGLDAGAVSHDQQCLLRLHDTDAGVGRPPPVHRFPRLPTQVDVVLFSYVDTVATNLCFVVD